MSTAAACPGKNVFTLTARGFTGERPVVVKVEAKKEIKLLKDGPGVDVAGSAARLARLRALCERALAKYKGSAEDKVTAINGCVTDGAVVGPKPVRARAYCRGEADLLSLCADRQANASNGQGQ